MSRNLAVIFSLMLALQAGGQAHARPDTLSLPCATAANIVKSAGAIVLGTGPDIYDRYVATKAFCQRDEEMIPRWIAARDTPACFIGYVCERRYGDPANR